MFCLLFSQNEVHVPQYAFDSLQSKIKNQESTINNKQSIINSHHKRQHHNTTTQQHHDTITDNVLPPIFPKRSPCPTICIRQSTVNSQKCVFQSNFDKGITQADLSASVSNKHCQKCTIMRPRECSREENSCKSTRNDSCQNRRLFGSL
jgi:hypothetical protein